MISAINLTSAQKAKETRAWNKAWAIMEQTEAPANAELEKAIDRFAPIRDALIERYEAERVEAIQKIEDEFRTKVEIQQAQFLYIMKPAQTAYDEIHAKAWKVFEETMATVRAEMEAK